MGGAIGSDGGGSGGDGADGDGVGNCDGVNVAADCRTARNTVPAAQALTEPLIKIEHALCYAPLALSPLMPEQSAARLVVAAVSVAMATVSTVMATVLAAVAVVTVWTSPPTVVLFATPCQRLRLSEKPILKIETVPHC